MPRGKRMRGGRKQRERRAGTLNWCKELIARKKARKAAARGEPIPDPTTTTGKPTTTPRPPVSAAAAQPDPEVVVVVNYIPPTATSKDVIKMFHPIHVVRVLPCGRSNIHFASPAEAWQARRNFRHKAFTLKGEFGVLKRVNHVPPLPNKILNNEPPKSKAQYTRSMKDLLGRSDLSMVPFRFPFRFVDSDLSHLLTGLDVVDVRHLTARVVFQSVKDATEALKRNGRKMEGSKKDVEVWTWKDFMENEQKKMTWEKKEKRAPKPRVQNLGSKPTEAGAAKAEGVSGENVSRKKSKKKDEQKAKKKTAPVDPSQLNMEGPLIKPSALAAVKTTSE